MAEKRMFSQSIIDSDLFLDMPHSTQNLYFHLCMRADDDGFINSPKKIMKIVSVAEDDLKLLIAKQFIIPFDSGIVVIKHWKIHNYIRSDRYHKTVNLKEKNMLKEAENKEYYIGMSTGIPNDIPLGDLDKNRIDKSSIEESNIYSQVVQYLNSKAKTKYRDNIESTKRLVKARLNQNFTLEDFKKVIDIKCKQWLNNDMKKYLRPETLFGNKFESYLNESPPISEELAETDTSDLEARYDKY